MPTTALHDRSDFVLPPSKLNARNEEFDARGAAVSRCNLCESRKSGVSGFWKAGSTSIGAGGCIPDNAEPGCFCGSAEETGAEMLGDGRGCTMAEDST